MITAAKWAVVVLVCLTSAAYAQHGRITGRVAVKATGQPLAGANVELIRSGADQRIGTTTGADGTYRIDGLPPDTFELRVSHAGYRTEILKDIRVSASDVATVTVDLSTIVYRAEEVVVSPSRRAENTLDAPVSITKIDALDIAQNPGANTFVGTLKSAKGVHYTQVGLFEERANARGYSTSLFNRMLLIVDGRFPVLDGGPDNFIGRSPVKNDIQDIEVILGPKSALYGPNAVAGVLSIRTKDPRESPGSRIALAGGSRRIFKASASHAGVKDRWGWKLAGNFQRGTDFSTAQTFYNSDSSRAVSDDPSLDSRTVAGEAALYYYPDFESAIRFSSGYRVSDNIIAFLNGGRVQIDGLYRHHQQVTYTSPGVYLNLYHEYFDQGDSYILHAKAQNILAGLSEEEAYQRAKLPAGFHNWAGEARLSHDLPWVRDGRVQIGFDYRFTDVEAGFLGHVTSDHQGFYGLVSGAPTDQLALSLSLRVDRPKGFPTELSPKGAILFKPREQTAFRLSLNRAHRIPGLGHQHLEIEVTPRVVYRGNPRGFRFGTLDGSPLPSAFVDGVAPLRPETNTTLETGVKTLVGSKVYLDLALFRGWYSSFISPSRLIGDRASGVVILDEAGAPIDETTFTNVNFGKQTATGFDVGLDIHPTDQVKIHGNLSFIEAGELTDAGGANVPFNTPRVKFGLGLSASDFLRSGTFLNVSLRHVNAFEYEEGVHVGTVPTYSIVDLNLGYKTSHGVTYKISAQNLFNNEHIEIPDGARIGQVVVAEVEYGF